MVKNICRELTIVWIRLYSRLFRTTSLMATWAPVLLWLSAEGCLMFVKFLPARTDEFNWMTDGDTASRRFTCSFSTILMLAQPLPRPQQDQTQKSLKRLRLLKTKNTLYLDTPGMTHGTEWLATVAWTLRVRSLIGTLRTLGAFYGFACVSRWPS